jgi:hypothetical protein
MKYQGSPGADWPRGRGRSLLLHPIVVLFYRKDFFLGGVGECEGLGNVITIKLKLRDIILQLLPTDQYFKNIYTYAHPDLT